MKKIHRFLVPALPEGPSVTLAKSDHTHQIASVLKIAPGEDIILFANGSDDMVITLSSVSSKEITGSVTRTIPALPQPKRSITAAVSIPKGDTFELIVQKLTELGVAHIIPIRSARTVKQSVRLDRLQAISDEAVEQCGGNRRVLIDEPIDLATCVKESILPGVVCDVSGTHASDLPSELVIYIGPEGGWSDDDLAILSGMQTLSLGPRTLRTETAAITAVYSLLWN